MRKIRPLALAVCSASCALLVGLGGYSEAIASVPAFEELNGVDNPLDGFVLAGGGSFPVLVDLDLDGDVDLFAGDGDGSFVYLENVGTADAPSFEERVGLENPLNGFVVGELSFPTAVDMNGDRLPDLVIGGGLRFLENTGTATKPVFTERTGLDNPLVFVSVGLRTTFGDIDADGDVDLVVSEGLGEFRFYENVGDRIHPKFELRVGAANPLDGVSLGAAANASFGDFDGDQDLDLVAGVANGALIYFENQGTPHIPNYVELVGASDPFDALIPGPITVPAVADLDGDGDPDLVSGSTDANFAHFVNPNIPAIVGGGVFAQAVDDPESLRPFETVTITEREDEAVALTVVISAARGSFIETNGFSDLGNGEYQLAAGTAAAAQAALRGMVFEPIENRVASNLVDLVGLRIVADDGKFQRHDVDTSVASLSLNDAPVLDGAAAFSMPQIAANIPSASNIGVSVGSLVSGDIITDVDAFAQKGLAIFDASSANGSWQYTTNGSTFQDIGAVSETSALVLSISVLVRIRFQPTVPGTNSPTLSFVAWDRTAESNGASGIDISVRGDRTPYSTTTATLAGDVIDDPFCGDGLLDAGEECDDGMANSNQQVDACRTDCTFAHCTDGVVDTGEVCDDGNISDSDACTSACIPATCGDGLVQSGVEECDDGGLNSDVDPDACRIDCMAPTCGDGVIDSSESCDDAENNSDFIVGACRTNCAVAGCGDGVLDAGEACDDGGNNSDSVADACRTTCVLPLCGDGAIDTGESCDDGVENSDFVADACRSDCTPPVCGDAVADSDEQCDEGVGNQDGVDGECRTDCRRTDIYSHGSGVGCTVPGRDSSGLWLLGLAIFGLGILRRRISSNVV